MAQQKKRSYSAASFIRTMKGAQLEVSTRNAFVSIENILKSDMALEEAADRILDTVLMENDIVTKKDALDRFIDYVYFKSRTGHDHIVNLAYPSKRIADESIEKKASLLINVHLVPMIIFSLLKFFTRNVQSSDTNLYVAQLLESDEVIQPIYNTFVMFRNDIREKDPSARTKNVKQLQQYVSSAEDRFSSPLDAACRLKYILEYLAITRNVSHLYSLEDIRLSKN